MIAGRPFSVVNLDWHSFDKWRIIHTLYQNKKQRTVNPRHPRSGDAKKVNASVTGNGKKHESTLA